MLLWYFIMTAADVLCWWNESVDAQSMLLIEISLMKQNSKSRYRPKRSVLLGYSFCGGRGTCRVTGHVTSLVNGVSHVTHAWHFAWLGMRSNMTWNTPSLSIHEKRTSRDLYPLLSAMPIKVALFDTYWQWQPHSCLRSSQNLPQLRTGAVETHVWDEGLSHDFQITRALIL